MEKPTITMDSEGPGGNVFAVMAEARSAIIAAARKACFMKAREDREQDIAAAEAEAGAMMREVMLAHSYDEALSVIRRYVTIQEKGGGL